MAALFRIFHLTVEMSEFKAFSIATHRFHDTLFPGLTSHELPPPNLSAASFHSSTFSDGKKGNEKLILVT